MSELQILLFSLILFILIVSAAFFACAETSLMAVNRYRLRHFARLKVRYAIHLLRMLKRPDRVLGTILIGSNFANILASSLATLLANYFWGERGAILAAFLLAIVMLIFSEIMPKTLAALYPDKVARWVVYPTQILLKFFYPMVWIVNAISNSLLSLLHIRINHNAAEPLTREELRSVVYDTTGKISRQYQNMLLSILDLNKLTVDDVMIPRHEIEGIDLTAPKEKILAQLAHFHQHEFVPVFRENINQIVGVLTMWDMLQLLSKKEAFNEVILHHFLQEVYFVPEGTLLYNQLIYFQQSHEKWAFVVDEYGEIQGLITINDIFEEIVGGFTSGLGVRKRIEKQADGSILVDGALTVREFNRKIGWHLPLSGPRTISGLIIEYLETLPHPDTTVLIANHPVEIVQVKEKKVKLAKVYPRLRREEESHE